MRFFLVAMLLAPAVAAGDALGNANTALTVLIGTEPQGDRGNPVAFGVGAEVLWKLHVGGFAALLSSAGAPVLPVKGADNSTLPSLADRISVPFGLAARPFASQATRDRWVDRLIQGIGVQIGIDIEHYRTSADEATVAGAHFAFSVDVPIMGSPQAGGLALRAYARLMVTPEITLQQMAEQKVHVGIANGQIFAGLCWYP